MIDRISGSLRLGCAAAAITILASCQTAAPPSRPVNPQPAPPLSDYTPAQPYRELAPGLMGQTVYTAPATGNLALEMWDLVVGPGKKSAPTRLPGGAVFEFRSGQGLITIANKATEVRSGTIVTVDDGQSFALENRSQNIGMSVRVALIRARQQ